MPSTAFLRPLAAVLSAAVIALSGCASTTAQEAGATNDPLMGFNRAMHGFNKGVDTYVVRPAAQGYDAVVPETVKHVVNNELRFLQLPGSFANSVLQGDFERAGDTAARFFTNATLGGLGLLDPATELGIAEHDEDFGQTLAVWGVDSGPYLELPLLGPSTLRDTAALPLDFALDPLAYVGSGSTTAAVIAARRPVQIVDTRYRFFDLIDEVLYESEDSYVAVRNAYLQRRRNAILNGNVTQEALPDIYDSEPF